MKFSDSLLPQQATINQYFGSGVTTVFTYAYQILLDTDIAVYLTPFGQLPDPENDIQLLNVDYTVQDAGQEVGGTVTFTVPPGVNDVVTLARNMQRSIDTKFFEAKNFNGANLDAAFRRVVLIMQQIGTVQDQRCLKYIIDSYLVPPTEGDTELPVLTDRQIWLKSGDRIIGVTLEENPDTSTLRSELASQANGADGARLIGYYDPNTASGKTQKQFNDSVQQQINIIVGTAIRPGTTQADWDPSPRAGWILWVDGTIGNAISGATVRANADTLALYTIWWNNSTDANLPVSGGRGVSALADFNADKTIQVPEGNGRVIVNLGNAVDFQYAQAFGESDHALTIPEIPAHQHGYKEVRNLQDKPFNAPSNPAFVGPQFNSATTNGAEFGLAGLAHNNIQESIAMPVFIKL